MTREAAIAAYGRVTNLERARRELEAAGEKAWRAAWEAADRGDMREADRLAVEAIRCTCEAARYMPVGIAGALRRAAEGETC